MSEDNVDAAKVLLKHDIDIFARDNARQTVVNAAKQVIVLVFYI